LAPQGRDAEVAAAMLAEKNLHSFICGSIEQMVDELVSGACSALIT
jgi:hypothetical protein